MARKYPAALVLLAVVAGIATADLSRLSPYPFLILGLVGFLAALFLVGKNRHLPVVLLLGLTIGSLAAFSFSIRHVHPGPNNVASLLNEPLVARVFGEVSDWPEIKPGRTEFVIALDSMGTTDAAPAMHVEGKLLLKVSDTTTVLQRGDRISFRTRLYPLKERPQASFDYGRYLRLQGLGAQAFLTTLLTVEVDRRPSVGYFALVDYLRSSITSSLERHLSSTAAALAKGFLIGETRDIPPAIYTMFRDSGTLHLLAVSGSNVALVLLFFVWLLRPFWFSPPTRALILLAVVTVFAGLSYGDPSVVRASIMAALVLGARLIGRKYDLNNIIATTALIILIVAPAQLYDVGFQLSFATAWALIFVTPRLMVPLQRFKQKVWVRWLLLPLLVTVIAQIFSAPVIAYYFGALPLISPLANLVIVPLVAIAVTGVMVLLLAHLIWPLLGSFVGSLLDLCLNGVVSVLHVMGGDNMPVLRGGDHFQALGGAAGVVVMYLLLILAVIAISSKPAGRILLAALVLLINGWLIVMVIGTFRSPHMTLDFRPVPGGVATIIKTDGSKRADLLFTGLTRRRYALDSTVCSPMLTESGVDSLGTLAILAADYEVLDDLIRLAADYGTHQLLLNDKLRPSFHDVHARSSIRLEREPLYFGSGDGSPPVIPGIHGQGDRLTVVSEGWQIGVTDQVTEDLFEPLALSPRAILIIGSTWQPAPTDWVRLRRAGWVLIVCAKLEQFVPPDDPDGGLDPQIAPPDYIIDLDRIGRYRLDLPR